MQIGIVGLGRMGANIGRRLMQNGHQVVGYDAFPAAVQGLEGATGATPGSELETQARARAPATRTPLAPAPRP